MQTLFSSENPFAEEELTKAFYYPAQSKEISYDAKKTCMSPKRSNEDPWHNAVLKGDDFLAKNHVILKDKSLFDENNKTAETSGSSRFNETWPSSEQSPSTVSVAGPGIDPTTTLTDLTATHTDSTAPLTKQTRQLVTNWLDDEHADSDGKLSRDGTLARYIQRFRSEPPKSRKDRDKSYSSNGKGGEFWWLSPPSSSSTPIDCDNVDSPLEKSPTSSKKYFGKPPKSPESSGYRTTPMRTVQQKTSTSDKTKDNTDTETEILRKRAEKLLKLSESTLDSSSTLSIPRKRAGPTKITSVDKYDHEAQKRLEPNSNLYHIKEDNFEAATFPRAPLRSEDDILYQWRLARKIEKAQQSAVAFPAVSYSKASGSERHARLVDHSSQVQRQTDLQLVPTRLSQTEQHSGLYRSDNIPTNMTETRKDKDVDDRTKNVASQTSKQRHLLNSTNEAGNDKDGIPLENKSKEASVQTPLEYKYFSDKTKGKLEIVDLPSHMHMMCDVLPCPHQRYILERSNEGDVTTHIPIAPPVISFTGEQAHPKTDPKYRERQSISSSSSYSNKETLGRQESFEKDTTKTSCHRPNDFPRSNAPQRHKSSKRYDKRATNDMIGSKGASKRSEASGIGNAIKQVVSDRLFPSVSTSSSTRTDEFESSIAEVEDGEREMQHNVEDTESSEEEFPDDELLKALRGRRRKYIEALRHVKELQMRNEKK